MVVKRRSNGQDRSCPYIGEEGGVELVLLGTAAGSVLVVLKVVPGTAAGLTVLGFLGGGIGADDEELLNELEESETCFLLGGTDGKFRGSFGSGLIPLKFC